MDERAESLHNVQPETGKRGAKQSKAVMLLILKIISQRSISTTITTDSIKRMIPTNSINYYSD